MAERTSFRPLSRGPFFNRTVRTHVWATPCNPFSSPFSGTFFQSHHSSSARSLLSLSFRPLSRGPFFNRNEMCKAYAGLRSVFVPFLGDFFQSIGDDENPKIELVKFSSPFSETFFQL